MELYRFGGLGKSSKAGGEFADKTIEDNLQFFSDGAMRHTLISVGLILIASCGSDPYSGTNPASVPSTFSAIQANILTPKCVICHNTQDPRGGFSASSYSEVMSSPGTVSPFQAYTSELYTQTQSGSMPKRDKDQNPNGTPLSSGELQAIYNWISSGAPNN
jgi:uncharacterized membrane protein